MRVGAPDKMGAAFRDIHQAHTADSFATMSLQKLDAFLQTSKSDVRYVFESYPVQSIVRVLLQLDAPEPTIFRFWHDLRDRLTPVDPWLLYFRESDPGQAMADIFRKRGPAWERYVVEALSQSPWMKNRALSGVEGVLSMVRLYSTFFDRLIESWRFPVLTLPARPESYEERTNTLIEWVTAGRSMRAKP